MGERQGPEDPVGRATVILEATDPDANGRPSVRSAEVPVGAELLRSALSRPREGGRAFVDMTSFEPRPSQEPDLVEVLREFQGRLEGRPGLLGAFLLKERGTDRLVRLSIWEDEAAFARAMETLPRAEPHPPADRFRETRPSYRRLEEL